MLPLLLLGAVQAEPAGNAPAFNAVLFEESVHARMEDLVKGYAFVVADTHGIQAPAAAGWAQDPADGKLPMNERGGRSLLSFKRSNVTVKECRSVEAALIGSGTLKE